MFCPPRGPEKGISSWTIWYDIHSSEEHWPLIIKGKKSPLKKGNNKGCQMHGIYSQQLTPRIIQKIPEKSFILSQIQGEIFTDFEIKIDSL